jgi:hypothetical protein
VNWRRPHDRLEELTVLALIVIGSMILTAAGLIALAWSLCITARRADDDLEALQSKPILPILVALDEITFDWPEARK